MILTESRLVFIYFYYILEILFQGLMRDPDGVDQDPDPTLEIHRDPYLTVKKNYGSDREKNMDPDPTSCAIRILIRLHNPVKSLTLEKFIEIVRK